MEFHKMMKLNDEKLFLLEQNCNLCFERNIFDQNVDNEKVKDIQSKVINKKQKSKKLISLILTQTMSQQLSEQQKKNRKAFSKTLKAEIKRKPHTQPINGTQYTYGLLQKKSQSSLFNNQRLLIIKGHQTFGYASKLPDDVLLPFLEQSKIPKCKVLIPVEKLDISNEKEILIVEFQEENKKEKTRWEFTCGSKVKAIEWRQKIQGAKNEKLLSLKNNAVKVILQDPNQNLQESEDETSKNKKIQIMNLMNKTQENRMNNQKMSFQNGMNSNNIVIKDDQSKPQRQKQGQQQKRQEMPHEKEENLNSQKFPQVNIFESLLYSPNKEKDDTSIVKELEKSSQNYGNVLKAEGSLDNLSQNKQKEESARKAKEEFLRRKKEQSEIKDELKEQGSFVGSLLKTISNQKYQIEKLKKEWGYEFAKGINQFETVSHFKTYVQLLVVKIVDELALQSRKRYYKPTAQTSESLKYEVEGVLLEFFFHELKEVTSFDKKGYIISSKRAKQAYQQLKNYDYILQLTNNKGRIRIPLAMCVEYKGFVCLAKVMVPEAQNYSNLTSLQKELDLLQAESRISNSIFEDGQNGRIVPLMNKVYDKIARTQNSFSPNDSKKFDICYVQSLKHYLPQDFFRQSSKAGQAGINETQVLRKQLIQDQEYQNLVFYGQNMVDVIHRLKVPQHLKEAVDTLAEVSKSISDRANALVAALENLDEVITNSKDLSKLMHGYGLNMRYLGLVLQRSHQGWVKSIIASQICARCAKSFLRFDLQDFILNLNQSKLENIRRFEIKQVMSFFNKVLGNSEQSQLFWTQLSRQAQQNFQFYIDKSLINVGYLLQALQCQCRVLLVNAFERKEDFFKVAEPLKVENFASFAINSKTYDLSFTELYKSVSLHLKELTQESFQQLSILLNLQRKGSLAPHFQLNNFDEKIILFMINWLPPSEGRQIYYPQQINLGEVLPNKSLYQIKLTEIKWLLKQKKQAQAGKVRDFIIQHVNRWLGEYHPILSQLYDVFSRYYLISKNEEKKSTTYCKSSIKNLQKLLGPTNIKLADNYYMLAEIYVNYQKKSQALNLLKRAKEILEENESEQSEAYGIIELRMGQIMLASNLGRDALEQGIKAYERLKDGEDYEKFVECIELIGRCYEIGEMETEHFKFSEQLISNITRLEAISEYPDQFQKILKIIIHPYLNQLSRNPQTSKSFLGILSAFSSHSNANSSLQSSSYGYLKSLIQSRDRSFPEEFIRILEIDLQELLEEVEESGIMTRWKGFQNVINNKNLLQKINSLSSLNPKVFEFLAILEAFTVFLGEGWVEGLVKDF